MNEKIIFEDIDNILSSKLPWNKLKGKTVLITGAGGFIASFIVKTICHLNDKYGLEITLILNSRKKSSLNVRLKEYTNRMDIKIFVSDISKPLELTDPPDYIIHAASHASPKYYSVDPVGTMLPNVIGTYNLLEFAKKKKVDKFLFLSSAEIYGEMEEKQIPTKENQYGYIDLLNVRSCYAESKRMGEQICMDYYSQFKIGAVIARLFHVYGPGMLLEDKRVQADFAANIIKCEDIELKSEGENRRSFCYITDAVKGIFTVLLKGKNGEAYNLGNSKEEISIKDLAEKLSVLFYGNKNRVKHVKRNINDSYMKSTNVRVCPDVSKIAGLGWKSEISINDGFKRMIEYYN
jgi:UDP-glucuronate decarboxylase